MTGRPASPNVAPGFVENCLRLNLLLHKKPGLAAVTRRTVFIRGPAKRKRGCLSFESGSWPPYLRRTCLPPRTLRHWPAPHLRARCPCRQPSLPTKRLRRCRSALPTRLWQPRHPWQAHPRCLRIPWRHPGSPCPLVRPPHCQLGRKRKARWSAAQPAMAGSMVPERCVHQPSLLMTLAPSADSRVPAPDSRDLGPRSARKSSIAAASKTPPPEHRQHGLAVLPHRFLEATTH
jgi:hypothetical protein